MCRYAVLVIASLCTRCGSACPAANVRFQDHELVSGASVDQVVEALEAQPFAPVELQWRADDTVTEATATITVERGTGRLSQIPSCVDGCPMIARPMIACGLDRIEMAAHGVLNTADGRVRNQAWTGELTAVGFGEDLSWQVSASIPLDEVNAPDVVTDVSGPAARGREVHLRPFLEGDFETLRAVSLDVLVRDRRNSGSNRATAIASEPDTGA